MLRVQTATNGRKRLIGASSRNIYQSYIPWQLMGGKDWKQLFFLKPQWCFSFSTIYQTYIPWFIIPLHMFPGVVICPHLHLIKPKKKSMFSICFQHRYCKHVFLPGNGRLLMVGGTLDTWCMSRCIRQTQEWGKSSYSKTKFGYQNQIGKRELHYMWR